ncbi:MAG: phosphoribosylanthranilate isomerase [Paracoccaceae bacterium]
MPPVNVKICGLTTVEAVQDTVAAGADYIGLVFFPKSPRNLDFDTAQRLAQQVPSHVKTVALMVNPSDDFLRELLEHVDVDILQLQGSESAERVREIKELSGKPVIKALGVSSQDDLATLESYKGLADQILLDAKAPKDADRPGGNGASFDWSLLTDTSIDVPWMLAGGLTIENVKEAITVSHARQVDVSSAVESAPGVKDKEKVRAFIAAAKSV